MPETQLQAVVLDWAGTVIDHGSLAPMGVFVRAFAQFGVEIRVDEARGPMGMAKRDHIQAVMNLPRVREAWRACHGAAPTEVDVDRVYDVFVSSPSNTRCCPITRLGKFFSRIGQEMRSAMMRRRGSGSLCRSHSG